MSFKKNILKFNPFNKKIGLALGGGAAKGLAHIGVLKVLKKENIEISYLSGTSIGALVASYYAFGVKVEDIEEKGLKLNIRNVINFTLKKRGLFTTEAFKEMILRDLGDVYIEDALIPLAICTTDITSGEQVIFQKGRLVDALCASMAVPGIYVPIEINRRLLVDGGITENVPVSVLCKMGAGITVAVDLNGVQKYPYPDDMIGVISNAFDIAIDLRTRDQLKSCDLTISLDLGKYSRVSNPELSADLVRAGEMKAKEALSRLQDLKEKSFYFTLKKLYSELNPLKIPNYLKSFFKKGLDSINIK